MLLNFVDVADTSLKKLKNTLRKESCRRAATIFPAIPFDERRASLCLHDLVSAAALFFDASVFVITGIVLSTVPDTFRVLARLHKSD